MNYNQAKQIIIAKFNDIEKLKYDDEFYQILEAIKTKLNRDSIKIPSICSMVNDLAKEQKLREDEVRKDLIFDFIHIKFLDRIVKPADQEPSGYLYRMWFYFLKDQFRRMERDKNIEKGKKTRKKKDKSEKSNINTEVVQKRDTSFKEPSAIKIIKDGQPVQEISAEKKDEKKEEAVFQDPNDLKEDEISQEPACGEEILSPETEMQLKKLLKERQNIEPWTVILIHNSICAQESLSCKGLLDKYSQSHGIPSITNQGFLEKGKVTHQNLNQTDYFGAKKLNYSKLKPDSSFYSPIGYNLFQKI